jgi:hypothetical protein
MRSGLELWLGFALNLVLPALVIRADERYRLGKGEGGSGVKLWNAASFWSAVLGFGPIALLVYFGRSRRSLWGWLLGVFWLLAVVAATGAAVSVLPTEE